MCIHVFRFRFQQILRYGFSLLLQSYVYGRLVFFGQDAFCLRQIYECSEADKGKFKQRLELFSKYRDESDFKWHASYFLHRTKCSEVPLAYQGCRGLLKHTHAYTDRTAHSTKLTLFSIIKCAACLTFWTTFLSFRVSTTKEDSYTKQLLRALYICSLF